MHASSAPWLSHYDAGVPPSLDPYPQRTLIDYLDDHVRERPHAAALHFKGAAISWSQVARESDALACALAADGVTQGDRIALLLPNCPQFVIAQFAAWKLGAIVAPLNPIYTEAELVEPLVSHDIRTVVTLSRLYPLVQRVRSQTPVRRVIVGNIKDYFPPLLRLAFTLLRERRDGDRVVIGPEDHRYIDLLKRYARQRPARATLTPDDAAVLLMSGGTTGTPKGALGRHAAYTCTGLQARAWTVPVLGHGRSVLMLPLPLFHVYANVGVQALSLLTASPIALVPNPRDLNDVVETVRRVKPSFFAGVPSLFAGLLNHSAVQQGSVDFKSIKLCLSGSAPLLAETKARFEAVTGGRIIEGYSLTEAMMALCVNPVHGPNKLGSVGMPLPDVEVRIMDADEGTTPLPTGEVGEVCFSALQLMVGFWNRPDETAGVLRDHVDGDGVRRLLHTGDLGYLDEDGYLFIVDRKKDLIKTTGLQVWPREVEEVLATHPAVAEVGVAGVPDAGRGEAVGAWVVLRPGMTVTKTELRAFCRTRMATYKVPRHVEFRTALPKTLVGKVLRRALRDEARSVADTHT